MRTTIDVDEELLAAVKVRAARQRTTQNQIIGDAIKAYLESCDGNRGTAPFELVVEGTPGGRFPTPQEVTALLDEEETGGTR